LLGTCLVVLSILSAGPVSGSGLVTKYKTCELVNKTKYMASVDVRLKGSWYKGCTSYPSDACTYGDEREIQGVKVRYRKNLNGSDETTVCSQIIDSGATYVKVILNSDLNCTIEITD